MKPTAHPRSVLFAFSLLSLSSLNAQKSFDDSLTVIAKRLAVDVESRGFNVIAVADLTNPNGTRSEVGRHIATQLALRMAFGERKFSVVDRGSLETVLQELKTTATGVFDDTQAIQLGRLAKAEGIVTGTMLLMKDKRLQVTLKLLNTERGTIAGGTISTIVIPLGFESKALARDQDLDAAIMAAHETKEKRGSLKKGPVWLSIGAGIMGQYRCVTPGLGVELLRDMDWDGGWGFYGLRVEYTPGIVRDVWLPYDLLYVTDEYAVQSAQFGYLFPGDLLVVASDWQPSELVYDYVDDYVIFDRVRISNANVSRWSFLLPIRLRTARWINRPKLSFDFGVGMDYLTMSADYTVTTEQFSQSGTTATEPRTYVGEYPLAAFSSHQLWYFGHVGLGLDYGRFSLVGSWRFGLEGKFMADPGDTGRDHMSIVRGDPFVVAVLNHEHIESTSFATDIALDREYRIGTAEVERFSDVSDKKSAMDKSWFDRTQMAVMLSCRIF